MQSLFEGEEKTVKGFLEEYGMVMPKVNREQIAGFTWSLPPLSLQEQFADFVQQSDKTKLLIHKMSKIKMDLQIN